MIKKNQKNMKGTKEHDGKRVLQLFKKFQAFCGSLGFILMSIRGSK